VWKPGSQDALESRNGSLINTVMGDILGQVIDYKTECGVLPLSFYQMLALCIVWEDGHWKINTIEEYDYCDDLESFWTCDNNHIDPESALVENIFAYDECGHLAIKTFINQGLDRGQL